MCLAVVLGVTSCVDPAVVAQRQAAEAAQQEAGRRAMVDELLAESPEGSEQQLESDLQIVNHLPPIIYEAEKDADLGLPLSEAEKNGLQKLTREQFRAIARFSQFQTWATQKAAQLKAETDRERLIQAQEDQARAQQGQAAALQQQNHMYCVTHSGALGPLLCP